MSSIPPIPNAVSSDLRIMGIPVNGLPDAINNTLQWDSINNLFVWVTSNVIATMNGVSITKPFFAYNGTPYGEVSFIGDENSKIKTLDNTSLGVGATVKSVIDKESNTAYQASNFGAFFILALQSSAGNITGLEVWASDTVDTADGTKIFETVQAITPAQVLTVGGKIGANQFITVKYTTGDVTVSINYSNILELTE